MRLYTLEARVFAVVAGAMCVLRIFLLGGGAGLVVMGWVGGMGAVGFERASVQYPAAKRFLRFVILPLAIGVLVVNLLFAEQVVFPFAAAVLLLGAAIPLWVQDRKLYWILVAALSVPIVLWCGWAVRHMSRVVTLWTLEAEDVELIRFAPEGRRGEPVVVRDGVVLEALCTALHRTRPYSRYKEHTREPWNMQIRFRDGGMLDFKIGKGTRGNPRASWIMFPDQDYSNQKLLETLTRYRLPTGGVSYDSRFSMPITE